MAGHLEIIFRGFGYVPEPGSGSLCIFSHCSQGAVPVAIWATWVETPVPDVWLLDDSGDRESMEGDGKCGTPSEQSVNAVHGYGADPDTRNQSGTEDHSG